MTRRVRVFLIAVLILGMLSACGVPMAGEPGPEAPQPTYPALPTGTPAMIPTAGPTAAPAVPPAAILESRRLTLELPVQIRAGDGDTIRMTLEMDELGNVTPTAEIAGHEVTGETVQIRNLYETHQVVAEARLDLAGAQVMPGDIVSEPLSPGKSVTFYWSVHIPEAGKYSGVAWLYMRYLPKDGGEVETETVAAQLFEIQGVTFFGLKTGPARWLGLIGSFFGTVLGFPFLEDILRWLWKRRK